MKATLALTCASVIFYIITLTFPFLTISFVEVGQTVSIWDCFLALLYRDNYVLAALFGTTLILFPIFEIFAVLYLLVPFHFNIHLRGHKALK